MLFTSFCIEAYCQTSLTGNWRRVNPQIKYADTINTQPKWGDLQIRPDSTFHMEGDSSTQNSTISGWHTGDEYNGTWELREHNRLTLWLEPKEHNLFLWFIIVQLTKDKLVLRLGVNKNDKKHDITYLRF